MGRISQACTSGTGNATFKSCLSLLLAAVAFAGAGGGGGDAASDLASVPVAGPVGLVFSSLAAPGCSSSQVPRSLQLNYSSALKRATRITCFSGASNHRKGPPKTSPAHVQSIHGNT